jgi:hypothetical protein
VKDDHSTVTVQSTEEVNTSYLMMTVNLIHITVFKKLHNHDVEAYKKKRNLAKYYRIETFLFVIITKPLTMRRSSM